MRIYLEMHKSAKGYRALGFVFDTSEPGSFIFSLAMLFGTVGIRFVSGPKKA